MAGEAKEMKFKFVVDEASVRQVHRMLDDIISKAQKVGQALQGAGGFLGGGGITAGGKPPSAQSTLARAGAQAQNVPVSFAKLVSQNVDAFKQVAREGGAAARAMGDSLGKSISDQERRIAGLRQAVMSLGQAYERVGSSAQKALVSQKMVEIGGKLGTAEERLSTLRATQASSRELMPEVPWPARTPYGVGGPPPLPGATPPAPEAGGGGFFGKGFKGALGSAVAVIGAAAVLGNEFQNIQDSTNKWKSARNQMMSDQMHRMKSMDLSQGVAVLRASKRSGEFMAGAEGNALHQATGTISGITSVADAILGAPVKLVKGLIGGGGVSGGEGGPGGATLGGLTPQGISQDKLRKTMEVIETERQAMGIREKMALDDFSSSMGSRIRAQRVMGIRGFERDKSGQYVNQYGDLQAQLMAGGYDVSEYMGAFQGLRSAAGSRFAGRNAYTAMAAQAQGFGDFAGLMATSARVGQGANLAFGAIGGGVDKSAGIMLGQAMLGSGFDIRGTTTGEGALTAAQAGMGFTGGAGDFNLAQRASAGLEFGGRLTGGQLDPLQQARNLVTAIGVDPSGGTYAQDYLANGMSLKQQLDMAHTGQLTATARALGIDQGMIKQQLGGTMSSVFERFADTGENTPMAQAVRNFRKSGMSATDYLQSLRGTKGGAEQIEQLGVAFAQVTGAGEEEGVGLAQLLSGANEKTLKRGGIGGRIGGAEKAALDAQAEIQKDLNDKLKGLGSTVEDAAKANAAAFKVFGQANEDLGTSSGKFVESIDKMVDALEAARAKLEGRPPPTSRAAQKEAAASKATAPNPGPEHIGHSF